MSASCARAMRLSFTAVSPENTTEPTGENARHQVRGARGRQFRVDRGRAVKGGIACRQRSGPRRSVHADRRKRSVVALAGAPRIKEQARQVSDVVGMEVGQEHGLEAREVESRVSEG